MLKRVLWFMFGTLLLALSLSVFVFMLMIMIIFNSDEVVEYYRKGYRRIFDNFLFSFEIYAADRLMLLRLCKSSLNELNRLNEKSLKQDKIVTTHLMRPYQRIIEKEHWKIERS